jgi:hypothetical protein
MEELGWMDGWNLVTVENISSVAPSMEFLLSFITNMHYWRLNIVF